MKDRIKLAVIFGGRSPEHDISCLSAEGLFGAINKNKYQVLPIRIEKTGKWIFLNSDSPCDVSLLPIPGSKLIRNFDGRVLSDIDVVFPILHGPLGEDGTIQGLLDLAEIPYIGSGVKASAISLDKVAMKVFFKHIGIPVAPYTIVQTKTWHSQKEDVYKNIKNTIGFPCFVKPACLGSSIGLSKVSVPAAVPTALDNAAMYSSTIIIEKAIENARDIEVSVIGCEQPLVSVIGEVIHQHEFLSYEAKYLDNTTRVQIPANLPIEVSCKIQNMAIDVFTSIGCEGLARVDFLLRDDGALYGLEINTAPGMTQSSMTPLLWAATGLNYEALIDRLVSLALQRYKKSFVAGRTF